VSDGALLSESFSQQLACNLVYLKKAQFYLNVDSAKMLAH